MSENKVDEGFTPTDPGFGASASPEPDEEAVAAEAKAEEPEVKESEAESPPADEENVDKKTDAFQARIDKLTKSFRESERSVEAKDVRIAKLEEELAAVPPEPAKTLADFEFDDDKYRQYLFDESTQRAVKAAEKVVQGFQEEKRDESVAEKFTSREKEFSKTVDDYADTVKAEDLRITQGMATEIRESDIGPEMAYYLGKHPDVATTLSKMTPREVIREMAILESTLRTEREKASKKVSGAPPPPAKIKGSSPGFKPATTDPKSDKLSDKEWFAAEEKRLAKMRG